LADVGLKNLSMEDLMSAKIHGVTPELIQSFADVGFKNLSMEDLMSAKIHSVTPEYIKSLADAGFKNLSMEDLMSAKIHGVTPQQVKSFIDLGFKNLSMEDLISVKIHGITADYITSMRKKGHQLTSIEDYVNLKLTGHSYSDKIKVDDSDMNKKSKDDYGQIMLNNKVYFYSTVKGRTKYYDRFGNEVNLTPKELSAGVQIEKQHEKNMRIHEANMRIHEANMKKHEANMSTHEANMKKHEANLRIQDNLVDMEQHEKSLKSFANQLEESGKHLEQHAKNLDRTSPLLRAMLDDNIISIGQKTQIELTGKTLKINGKSMSDTDFLKYKKLYETASKRKMNTDDRYEFDGVVKKREKNSLQIDGSISVTDKD
jgi:hypothetical protein